MCVHGGGGGGGVSACVCASVCVCVCVFFFFNSEMKQNHYRYVTWDSKYNPLHKNMIHYTQFCVHAHSFYQNNKKKHKSEKLLVLKFNFPHFQAWVGFRIQPKWREQWIFQMMFTFKVTSTVTGAYSQSVTLLTLIHSNLSSLVLTLCKILDTKVEHFRRYETASFVKIWTL